MNTILENLKNAKVLVIGDCMLDTYYEGDAERISPEAPVPVVKIEKTKYLLGGAANVARNITAFGASCGLISIIGKDFAGIKIKELLQESNIQVALIESSERPSTVKSRVFARNQQIVRFDEEFDKEISRNDRKILLQNIEKKLCANTIIILSDYGKGILYKNIISDIADIAKKKNIAKPKILIDPKPKNKKYYTNSFILTPNAKETEELSGVKIKGKKDIIKAGKLLQNKLNAENLLITLGSEGMALFLDNKIIHIKSTAKQVYDVTGAGDTVIATLATCLNVNADLKEACEIATLAAGIVVEKVGSATASITEIENARNELKIFTDNWL